MAILRFFLSALSVQPQPCRAKNVSSVPEEASSSFLAGSAVSLLFCTHVDYCVAPSPFALMTILSLQI